MTYSEAHHSWSSTDLKIARVYYHRLPNQESRQAPRQQGNAMEAKEILSKLNLVGAYTHYDQEGDVLYISFSSNQAQDSIEISKDVIVDLDGKGRPVGLTILTFENRIKERQASSPHQ